MIMFRYYCIVMIWACVEMCIVIINGGVNQHDIMSYIIVVVVIHYW